MATATHRVKIYSVDGLFVKVRLTTIDDFIVDLDKVTKTLAFRVLISPILKSRSNAKIRRSPLATQVDIDCTLDDEFVKENAGHFIQNVTEIRRGKSYLNFSFILTDSIWGEHINPGETWETATVYDSGGGSEWAKSRMSEKYKLGRDLKEAFRIGQRKEDDPMLRKAQVDEFLIPTRSIKHYRVEAEISGENLTYQNAKLLLGRPVQLSHCEDGVYFGSLIAVTKTELIVYIEQPSGYRGLYATFYEFVTSIGEAVPVD
ncbi:MAG: hypothetical protein NXI24_22740 [bacterium]|nr:hypothetical protein [bacterium]